MMAKKKNICGYKGLGDTYHYGYGVKPNIKKAKEHYLMAIESIESRGRFLDILFKSFEMIDKTGKEKDESYIKSETGDDGYAEYQLSEIAKKEGNHSEAQQ
ncbi:hypothetical protein BKG91_06230 [Rodentibacter caecimuris]|uniref:Beta-lactamase n=2 Tax=Rodentibacter caecimuris TaxID=1796644 RepID=A0AAJ3MZN5_9PAST|nr:SEL1-like repeat protein [Rodentibacter heylii]AOF53810.1 hypothetical protein AC062_1718 [Pasteurellaceae bacterium NI1060]OOF72988.1 hypothetical protein BKG90_02425 [Rodentibacter heylii]OOF74335.1 hypothetical protein BKG99_10395 [Rodentibacter heylii]OOF74435.1 hypothetical protein BKG91_06230 [Rodentibacter heylii]